MKLNLIGMIAVVLALSGCASAPVSDPCAAVENSDRTYTIKATDITVSRCENGRWLPDYARRCESGTPYDNTWYTVMKNAHEHRQDHEDKRAWRLPTKEDAALIGKCLKTDRPFWVAATTDDKQHALVFDHGRFVERGVAQTDNAIHGVFISGGNETAQQAYQKLLDGTVQPYLKAKKAAWDQQQAQEQAALKARIAVDERQRAELARRQAIALSSSPKGTLLNCNTENVVPVNRSLNEVNFSCPTLGRVDLEILLKNKWKMISSERIKAQASSYSENAYGMYNWNGQGVIISIMVEKR